MRSGTDVISPIKYLHTSIFCVVASWIISEWCAYEPISMFVWAQTCRAMFLIHRWIFAAWLGSIPHSVCCTRASIQKASTRWSKFNRYVVACISSVCFPASPQYRDSRVEREKHYCLHYCIHASNLCFETRKPITYSNLLGRVQFRVRELLPYFVTHRCIFWARKSL